MCLAKTLPHCSAPPASLAAAPGTPTLTPTRPALPCPAVYSLVKHGGVRNCMLLTWTAQDLEACTDLNLPCADVTHMLAEPLSKSSKDA
jgi:hypothetical protein